MTFVTKRSITICLVGTCVLDYNLRENLPFPPKRHHLHNLFFKNNILCRAFTPTLNFVVELTTRRNWQRTKPVCRNCLFYLIQITNRGIFANVTRSLLPKTKLFYNRKLDNAVRLHPCLMPYCNAIIILCMTH